MIFPHSSVRARLSEPSVFARHIAISKRAIRAIGAGLVVMGGAAGIGRVGGSAVESMARPPEVAGQISTGMIITAAMIEGATLFAVVVGLLAVLL